ncbi:MAG: hypothetical protein PHE12_03400, partial [Clostridia bacterium]|nr:hypothetical protein [Clostridia bacterium]
SIKIDTIICNFRHSLLKFCTAEYDKIIVIYLLLYKNHIAEFKVFIFAMKKLSFAIILFCLCALAPFAINARALAPKAGFARVLEENVMLYRTPQLSEDKIFFTLPKTYYLKIIDLNVEGDCYQAEYQANENGYVNIIGYVKKEQVTVWDKQPGEPLYPEISAQALSYAPVYQNAAISEIKVNVFSGQTVKLYGSVYNAEEDILYFYVLYANYEGYVQASMFNITLPPNHSDPLPTPPPEDTPPPEETASPTNSPNPSGTQDDRDSLVQILLIAAICIPALIIVYLMFRPSKKTRRNYKDYYNSDEDE